MTTTWTNNQISASAESNDTVKKIAQYEPNIGAPFKVILLNSVQQTVSKDGEVLDTSIPNLDGLLKEVAFARSLDRRKFSPADITFVRKAVGLKAIDLADLLGVSPEHISRCEKGDRTLSVAAEKLLRVIVLKKRHDPAELAKKLEPLLENDGDKSVLDANKVRVLKSLVERYRTSVEEIETAIFDSPISTVFEVDDPLCFAFEVVSPEAIDLEGIEDWLDEELWQPADSLRAA